MRAILKRKSDSNFPYMTSLALLLVSNICFYVPEKLTIYILTSAIAMILTFTKALLSSGFSIKIGRSFVWLTVIYGIFTLYGLCFLRYGTYNWDMMLFTYAQNIALVISLKNILRSSEWFKSLKKPIIIATLFTLVYLVILEAQNLSFRGIRIGDSLSGNVNTVGASLGLLSIFLAFVYCKEKKFSNLIVFIATVTLMLLTGSKMTIIVLAMDFVLFLMYSRGKATTWLAVAFSACCALYIVFNVPYFYDVIGSRIEDMFFQLFGIGHGRYSISTNSRLILIQEGFKFFWDYPIFGGGEKYFGSKTSTIYSYSHCNYTEMLCNFGIVGTLIYYAPILYNFKRMIKGRQFTRDISILCIVLMTTRLLLDWMQVTHSEICVGYIPMLLSFVIVPLQKRGRRNQYVETKNSLKTVEAQ